MKDPAEHAVGDRVVCAGDNIDGSYEGEEGTVVGVNWNDGGAFAGPRWVYSVDWDCDCDGAGKSLMDTPSSSDDFAIEAA